MGLYLQSNFKIENWLVMSVNIMHSQYILNLIFWSLFVKFQYNIEKIEFLTNFYEHLY